MRRHLLTIFASTVTVFSWLPNSHAHDIPPSLLVVEPAKDGAVDVSWIIHTQDLGEAIRVRYGSRSMIRDYLKLSKKDRENIARAASQFAVQIGGVDATVSAPEIEVIYTYVDTDDPAPEEDDFAHYRIKFHAEPKKGAAGGRLRIEYKQFVTLQPEHFEGDIETKIKDGKKELARGCITIDSRAVGFAKSGSSWRRTEGVAESER